ncbi:helix-turn-helix domain-containing protein [Priestia flexa]|uniref:helix-turn-helix domain-containing protein n=1 Tax=Priestia flexa TaxID=86664 RepID=UPI000953CF03|nr:helix-turn-helix transcriptional regulator [Priestia flexa]MCG7315149.1 helix-turn-helix domain-containing protein [Priestia flexa]WHX80463.1 helix-turn-helix transcriptional regulator [Priestia flexa]SIR55821.1 DNA-binding transcriptional regulator, XRE-family HTH domain [Priestia flexa]
MDIEQAFGIVIKKYRLGRSMSQERLAFEADLDRTFISLLERGKRKPTINTLFSISKVLEVRPHKIVKDVEILLQQR